MPRSLRSFSIFRSVVPPEVRTAAMILDRTAGRTLSIFSALLRVSNAVCGGDFAGGYELVVPFLRDANSPFFFDQLEKGYRLVTHKLRGHWTTSQLFELLLFAAAGKVLFGLNDSQQTSPPLAWTGMTNCCPCLLTPT